MPEYMKLHVVAEVEFEVGQVGPDNHAEAVRQVTRKLEAVEGAKVKLVTVANRPRPWNR